MQAPANPSNEALRIETLRQFLILDTPPEERFDNLTRAAASFFRVQIAVVSLVDVNRQWFKSTCGLDAKETPRDISFCGHAILQDDVMLVHDALLDPRFADNPLVTGEPKIRFYAGAPLKASNGVNVGTLCLIDREPKMLTPTEIEMLQDMARVVVGEIEKTPALLAK
ncbi:GAF domain-containing protein [Chitinibacter bivalviorum]|uniref:GAF domain-containing protein n=1 Tax=Chitinibacter bivalviorum TaxID=2739434 RepID=A0A7H9BFH9_9NEIS|nr:GAF domain-containing protein [Chitinibacter bivalviorum]QLG87379.1 GAF domain-containing protein [Chitinibacter bivalviorum]